MGLAKDTRTAPEVDFLVFLELDETIIGYVKWGPEDEANEKYHLGQPPGGDNPSRMNQPIQ